jgi:hypothetical protein
MSEAISQDRERCQLLFRLMKNAMLYRAARAESGREGRERFLIAPFGRTQSEWRRRLALASGFRLVADPQRASSWVRQIQLMIGEVEAVATISRAVAAAEASGLR